jgi:hypothetical protein
MAQGAESQVKSLTIELQRSPSFERRSLVKIWRPNRLVAAPFDFSYQFPRSNQTRKLQPLLKKQESFSSGMVNIVASLSTLAGSL